METTDKEAKTTEIVLPDNVEQNIALVEEFADMGTVVTQSDLERASAFLKINKEMIVEIKRVFGKMKKAQANALQVTRDEEKEQLKVPLSNDEKIRDKVVVCLDAIEKERLRAEEEQRKERDKEIESARKKISAAVKSIANINERIEKLREDLEECDEEILAAALNEELILLETKASSKEERVNEVMDTIDNVPQAAAVQQTKVKGIGQTTEIYDIKVFNMKALALAVAEGRVPVGVLDGKLLALKALIKQKMKIPGVSHKTKRGLRV